eukprot:CAMPEP_0115333204 /NCGR_PEP_ID=MMETSP0270-20121206/87245_1 /TAXON_ID=71861 /ORGANISM="Scrippsiella trochoidea, Strain CCMP3099" /LENGTH=116 /DNA_ID=CAMNT_0002754089 /DNA_START=99 /DNA_END=445 /DNA_ORIENTATION=+
MRCDVPRAFIHADAPHEVQLPLPRIPRRAHEEQRPSALQAAELAVAVRQRGQRARIALLQGETPSCAKAATTQEEQQQPDAIRAAPGRVQRRGTFRVPMVPAIVLLVVGHARARAR